MQVAQASSKSKEFVIILGAPGLNLQKISAEVIFSPVLIK